MRRFSLLYILFLVSTCAFAQTAASAALAQSDQPSISTDSLKTKTNAPGQLRKKLLLSSDTLTMSDYTLSIERVNDNLIGIGDSAKLGFEVVRMSRRIGIMTDDISLIRQNMRGRRTVFNIKNQYLYQRYTSKLEIETDRIQAQLNNLYKRVNHAKLHLNGVLSDSIFRKLYADKELRTVFKQKLTRLERKYERTDSITRSNVDSLNVLKVRLSDNSYNLSNMLNIMDNRMDKAVPKLFGHEVNRLWEKEIVEPPVPVKTSYRSAPVSTYTSEKNAIGYYIKQTSGERKFILFLGILLFTWFYFKRKLIKMFGEQKDVYSYLHLQYLNSHPVLSLIVVLLSLMPLFDAYAPTSYISIVSLILLAASTRIFQGKHDRTFLVNWLLLIVLFVADALVYLFIEPTFAERLLLLAIHLGIIVFAVRFYRSLHKEMPYFRLLKWATIIGIILSCQGILFNLFGRFSLSGIVGVAAIFAVTQAVILTVFVEVIIEIIVVQLQTSRLKKGINGPFDTNIVIKKIKTPLILIAVFIWLIMLASNLNIYHSISNEIMAALTAKRTIGSITFQMLSVILFIGIIWTAHIMQRLLSFILGETGIESEDVTTVTKGQHSRLLITRLLVLIGGYLLAIAASGLPIDKLTFLLGALGVGIGMGLQHIVNNVVSGVILIFDGTLQVGDEIEVSGQSGKVKEIGLRASTLTTDDGADVIIPNGSILSSNIVNWTFTNNEKRVILTFSLKGKELDANVINEVINNTIRKIPNVITIKKPVILYTKVTSETCSLTIRFWSTTTTGDMVKSEAMLQLSAAFAAREIGFE
jgi:small-conductance mechanosensitive channel